MKFYLRDKNNNNLFKAKVYVKTEHEVNLTYSYVELKTNVYITNYSNFLLNNQKKSDKIINDFNNLNSLRGWLWERFFMTGNNNATELNDVIEKLKPILAKVAKDYKLFLIIEENE